MRFVAAKADLSMCPRSVATWLVITSCLKETDIAPQTAPVGTCRPPAFIPPATAVFVPLKLPVDYAAHLQTHLSLSGLQVLTPVPQRTLGL